jgi:hydrogenase/urease accessory protein HupE
MQLEATEVLGATLMIWNNGRKTLPVMWLTPEMKSVGLVHGHHHGAEIIRLAHGVAGFGFLDTFLAAQGMEAPGEIIQFFAFGGD